jgi:hypothetical protein
LVDFLIVGTPRSGTTLLQRLACELSGVQVPPETHFFRSFAGGLLRRRTFPLDEAALRAAVAEFAALPTSHGLGVRVDDVVARLGGRCATLTELFATLVRHLAPDAAVLGEKTPSHLLWWRPLTRALPHARLLGIVRDPRAVVASYYAAWGPRPHGVLAHRWAIDQRQLDRAAGDLGPHRCHVFRYEDVVRDPDGARSQLAALLAVDDRRGEAPASRLFLPWESWKGRTTAPITTAHVDAWRRGLDPAQAADIARICRAGMRRWGYADADARRLPVSLSEEWSGRRYRLDRARRDVRIRGMGQRATFG